MLLLENNNPYYMDLAIKEAWKYQGLTYPNPAVGAVIVDEKNQILSISAHKGKGKAHAELNAVKKAFIKITNSTKIKKIKNPSKLHKFLLNNHNNIFNNSTIYVTLEPCNHHGSTPPCSLLLSTLKFKRVVIATKDPNQIATGGYKKLKNENIDVALGVCEDKAKKLLYPFQKWNNDNFVFFKLAMSLNGTIASGIITSQISRKMVHKLRDKIDLLVIGGNTVRIDNPILDARLVSKTAPDILIYSQKKEFDKNLKLFKVKNRKVYIEDNFDRLKDYKFIMIEGGEGMLKASEKIIDWYLIFQTQNFKSGKQINYDLTLSQLSSHQNSSTDSVKWSSPVSSVNILKHK